MDSTTCTAAVVTPYPKHVSQAQSRADSRNQLQALYREVEELNRDEHYSTKRDLYKQGEDLDTVTITKNRPPPTIDHSLVPAARN